MIRRVFTTEIQGKARVFKRKALAIKFFSNWIDFFVGIPHPFSDIEISRRQEDMKVRVLPNILERFPSI